MLPKIVILSGVVGLALVSAEASANVCKNAVQGKIAWDKKGTKTWAPQNLARLCKYARTTEPAKCFQRVMKEGLQKGKSKSWSWKEVIDLCEQSKDANLTIECYNRVEPRTGSRNAIPQCDERMKPQVASRLKTQLRLAAKPSPSSAPPVAKNPKRWPAGVVQVCVLRAPSAAKRPQTSKLVNSVQKTLKAIRQIPGLKIGARLEKCSDVKNTANLMKIALAFDESRPQVNPIGHAAFMKQQNRSSAGMRLNLGGNACHNDCALRRSDTAFRRALGVDKPATGGARKELNLTALKRLYGPAGSVGPERIPRPYNTFCEAEKGSVYDAEKGKCVRCPGGFKRSGRPVDSQQACTLKISTCEQAAAMNRVSGVSKWTRKKLPDGRFQCFGCPAGFVETGVAFPDGRACAQGKNGKKKHDRAFKDRGAWWYCPKGFKKSVVPGKASSGSACAKGLQFKAAKQMIYTSGKEGGFIAAAINSKPTRAIIKSGWCGKGKLQHDKRGVCQCPKGYSVVGKECVRDDRR